MPKITSWLFYLAIQLLTITPFIAWSSYSSSKSDYKGHSFEHGIEGFKFSMAILSISLLVSSIISYLFPLYIAKFENESFLKFKMPFILAILNLFFLFVLHKSKHLHFTVERYQIVFYIILAFIANYCFLLTQKRT